MISNCNRETINGHSAKMPRKLRYTVAEGRRERGTYVYAHIRVFVDCRWEEQEIPGFASLLELGIKLVYNFLGSESLDGFGRGHNPLSESSSGITMEAEGNRSDKSGTRCYNLEIGGG